MSKRFDEWNEVKKTEEINDKIANFRQKEIFVTNIGENVGFEQNSKITLSCRDDKKRLFRTGKREFESIARSYPLKTRGAHKAIYERIIA